MSAMSARDFESLAFSLARLSAGSARAEDQAGRQREKTVVPFSPRCQSRFCLRGSRRSFADHKPQARSILRPILGVRGLFVFFERLPISSLGIPMPVSLTRSHSTSSALAPTSIARPGRKLDGVA